MTKTATTFRVADRDTVESRFARQIAAALDERTTDVAPEISERLRFAREQALDAARRLRATDATSTLGGTAGGAALLGFSRSRWWLPIASVLPVVALAAGLVLIEDRQTDSQLSVAAEVDAALLGDDLPITAYRDPGFVEFLKAPPGE